MKLTKLLILLLATASVNAQVKFERLSLNEAYKQAGITSKIIFAQFVSSTCEQCNEVADKAFTDKELGNTVKEKCIAIKIDLDNPDRGSFIEKYNPNEVMGSCFITADGDMLLRMASTSSWPPTYIAEIEKAYNQFVEGRLPLKELDNLWNLSNNDFAAMEMNLRRRTELGLLQDSLLDVYVSRLPADSLISIRVLQFIARQAPIINSQASIQLRKNTEPFNQAWYKMPLNERISINNRITYKSRMKAVKNKDRVYAFQVANFARAVHSDASQDVAIKNYRYQLWSYYKEIKDTTLYLSFTINYADSYYMKPSLDSIKQKDSLNTISAKIKIDSIKRDNNKIVSRRFAMKPIAQHFCTTLNECAWLIYTSTADENSLQKALGYAERALQFFDSPEAMDTYARLLYQKGNTRKAITWQEKAIKILTERGYPAARFKTVLQRMKEGTDIKKIS